MHVQFLGTGSADGWPNAFCQCAACLSAQQLRCPTSVLVDNQLLLDCGPETPRNALRYAQGLRNLRYLLITHDHPDHSAPMALLSRTWAQNDAALTICGPQSVLDSWSRWVSPNAPIHWRAVTPGDDFVLGSKTQTLAEPGPQDYRVRVLAAQHGDAEAVLYDLCDASGTRLLYATDTGPLPDAAIDMMTDAAYALVLLEATFGDRQGPGRPTASDHLDLQDFGQHLARMRHVGAITPDSIIAPIHLSHHSPVDLESRIRGWGGQLVHDGERLVLGSAGQKTPRYTRAAARHLPRRTLILGGARSGKSHTAEQLFADQPEVLYVATGTIPSSADPDWAARVASHRQRRPQHWTTVETTDLVKVLREARQPLLIDCLSMWLTAVLTEVGAWTEEPAWGELLERRVAKLMDAWHQVEVPVVAVSNEVGSAVVPSTLAGRIFRDQLGLLNRQLSLASERVLLTVAGRSIPVTGVN